MQKLRQLEEVVAFQDEQLKNCKQGGMGANNGIIGDIANSSEGAEAGSMAEGGEGSNAGSADGNQGNGSIAINTSAPSGESYRIQIGFYDKRDLSHLIDNGLVMRYENVDGTMRYSLGDFSSLKKLRNSFKSSVRCVLTILSSLNTIVVSEICRLTSPFAKIFSLHHAIFGANIPLVLGIIALLCAKLLYHDSR